MVGNSNRDSAFPARTSPIHCKRRVDPPVTSKGPPRTRDGFSQSGDDELKSEVKFSYGEMVRFSNTYSCTVQITQNVQKKMPQAFETIRSND